MSLWGKTDVEGSKPKYLNAADKAAAFFVSTEEAQLDTNKKKGITNAGWWIVKEHTDSSGNVRYKANCLVAISVANSISGDAADDATVADIEVSITITGHPTDQNTSGGAATFTVTATATSGSLTYQWQKRTSTGRWGNVVGATSASIALTGQTSGNTADQYRVVVGSTSGAVKVTSNAAVLTFVD